MGLIGDCFHLSMTNRNHLRASLSFKARQTSREDFRGFVLPPIWSVNNFLLKMINEVFRMLCPCFQIVDYILIRKAYKGEKCYRRDTKDTSFFEAAFIAGLRLPLSEIHRRLANHFGISVCQIAPNAWRIFIGLKCCGDKWVEIIGDFPSTSSFTITSPRRSQRRRAFTILLLESRPWNLYLTCLIPIVIGKVDISLWGVRTVCVSSTSGIV